jgi:hypothetical protein
MTRKEMLRVRISELNTEIQYAEQRKLAYEEELELLEQDK